jgi:membrane protease YdiL (CAAX protease family)
MLDAGGQCSGCHRPVRAGTPFCPGCGSPLNAYAVAPVQPAAAVSGVRAAADWEELKRVGWLFGLLLGSSLVIGLAGRGTASPWTSVAISAFDAAVVLVAVALRFQNLTFLFRIHPLGPHGLRALAGAAIAFVAAATGYFWILEHLGVPFAHAGNDYLRAGWPLWATLVMISLAPAVFEELAFRGVIQSSLERVFNARDAWLIQAALFSVLHLSPLIFPSHFLMGLCFGYMRMRSRSIYPGMLLHACWNALVVLQELH